jgi:hypothetical protein
MVKQRAYEPVFEDWLFHAALPLCAYGLLGLAAIALPLHPRPGLFGVGGATLLLLYVGLHNAWDGVSYHVLVVRLEHDKKLQKKEEADSRSRD